MLQGAVGGAEPPPPPCGAWLATLSTSNSLQKPMQWLVSWSTEGATCRQQEERRYAQRSAGLPQGLPLLQAARSRAR